MLLPSPAMERKGEEVGSAGIWRGFRRLAVVLFRWCCGCGCSVDVFRRREGEGRWRLWSFPGCWSRCSPENCVRREEMERKVRLVVFHRRRRGEVGGLLVFQVELFDWRKEKMREGEEPLLVGENGEKGDRKRIRWRFAGVAASGEEREVRRRRDLEGLSPEIMEVWKERKRGEREEQGAAVAFGCCG
ncbi:hypothetical protein HAX54_001243 [Datura stramonium]|uniref:Uncharacterized protein n=1 Tax=Datura stramonium TaxID=4076 RepID=A0ABS8WTJ4_DATST|nr:hypothetical protein [Datura stramonium]